MVRSEVHVNASCLFCEQFSGSHWDTNCPQHWGLYHTVRQSRGQGILHTGVFRAEGPRILGLPCRLRWLCWKSITRKPGRRAQLWAGMCHVGVASLLTAAGPAGHLNGRRFHCVAGSLRAKLHLPSPFWRARPHPPIHQLLTTVSFCHLRNPIFFLLSSPFLFHVRISLLINLRVEGEPLWPFHACPGAGAACLHSPWSLHYTGLVPTLISSLSASQKLRILPNPS